MDKIKKEFDEINILKSNYETKFNNIMNEQEGAKQKFEEILKQNEEQNKRLQILEMQEKATAAIHNEDYAKAMEYTSAGLELSPDDLILLSLKMNCLARLRKYTEAVQIGERYHKLYQNNISVNTDLIELSLLLNRTFNYEEFIGKLETVIENIYSDYLIWYFECIRIYHQGNKEKLTNHIFTKVKRQSTEKKERISGWKYSEARDILKPEQDKEKQSIIYKVLDYLDGEISELELTNFIDELK